MHLGCWGRFNGVDVGSGSAPVLVDFDADVTIKGRHGMTAMLMACQAGADRELIQVLLQNGPAVSLRAMSSRSILCFLPTHDCNGAARLRLATVSRRDIAVRYRTGSLELSSTFCQESLLKQT